MLDSSGFVRKSHIFDGNVSEPTTFKEILDKLNVQKKNTLFSTNSSLVVMDAGIASQENIDYLLENGYEYIVVSRKKEKQFYESKSMLIKLDSKQEVIVRAQKVINENGEIELFVHCPNKVTKCPWGAKAREAKEEEMQKRVQNLFVESLQYLKDGLTLKRRAKKYETIIERIGRLKQKYSAIRHKLKKSAIHYSWDSIRGILESTNRVTTSMKCKDGTTLYTRQGTELNSEQKEIFDALGMCYQIRDISRSYIE